MDGKSELRIAIMGSGLYEVPSERIPGGTPEIDYRIALELSKSYSVVLLSPFFPPYVKEKVKDSLIIRYLHYPAVTTTSNVTSIRLCSGIDRIFGYLSLAAIELLKLFRKGRVDVFIFSDKRAGVFPSLFARFVGINGVIFSEGNTYLGMFRLRSGLRY